MAVEGGLSMASQIKPVLAALRHHRSAATLVALQIALTLAIVCNALYIAQQRVAHLSRPSGIDEANIGVIHNEWLGRPGLSEASAMTATDLALLRQLPGVADAYVDVTYPAVGPWASLLSIKLQPDQSVQTSYAELYTADDHTLATLGLQLVAGRNFRADEVVETASVDGLAPASIIVTRELAEVLFPHQSALGKVVYFSSRPSTIVGVVAHLQVPAVNTNSFAFRSVLVPARVVSSDTGYGGYYMIRAKPDQLDAVLRDAPSALRQSNSARLIDADGGVARYSDLRSEGYARDRGTAVLMIVICVVLLLASAGGIVGLTSFWVSQRRRQIGIRRALGATLADILHYFQTENFLIVTAGIGLGMLLAVLLNVWLMQHFPLPRLPLFYLPMGAVILWLLGQLAVLGPAWRAAKVAPVVATRSG
jgi:putative ABC transport system permease protein